MRLETAPDADALAERVAGAALRVLSQIQQDRRDPVLALTGGSMGIATLAAMNAHAERDTVNWARVTLIWGDERWLPASSSERNDLQADAALLRALPLDPARVHRVDAADAGFTLDESAARYATIIDALPRIDLAFYGVGPDGHLASLFPGRDDLLVRGSGVPAAFAVRDSPKPPPERVSLSLDAIDRADQLWLLAAGSGKADAVANLRSPGIAPLPAALVHGRSETVLWVDAAALRAHA